MPEVGPLTLTTKLDTGNFDSEMDGLTRRLDRAEGRGEELNTVFDRMGGVLDTVQGAVEGIGMGVLAFVASAVAMSPQLKKMFAQLHPVLFQLGNYIGQKLSPLFDSIVQGARHFKNELVEIDQKYGVLDKISSLGEQAIDMTLEVDDQTNGALSFMLAAAGIITAGAWAGKALNIVLSPVLSAGKGLLGWIASAFGLSSGVLGYAGAAGVIGGLTMLITISYKMAEDPEKAIDIGTGGKISESVTRFEEKGVNRENIFQTFQGQGPGGLGDDLALAIWDFGRAVRGFRETVGLEGFDIGSIEIP